jgi:hypothetical protein
MLKHILKWRSLLVILVLAVMGAAPAPAQAPQRTEAGLLKCKLNPSIGFIIFGHQSMECRFDQPKPYPAQFYEGAINTVGLDVGVAATGILGWTVIAPTIGLEAGALAGEYVGASADAAFGLGVGANVLIGGSGRTISLQPLSLEGSVALEAVAGLSQLKLRAVR